MLRIHTLFIGQNYLSFPELESTNQYAIELLSKIKPSEGTVISTDFQSQGRGQIGSSWHSAAHQNLTFSCILYPTFLPVKDQFYLNQAIALAICETVRHFVKNGEVKVKWPNDIYINDQKVAGILIQNALHGKQILNSVIGIGINVLEEQFPAALPNPTSIIHWTNETLDRSSVLAIACHNLEKWYLTVKRNQFNQIREAYQQALYRFATESFFQRADTGEVIFGKIVGTNPTGKLMIEHKEGISTFAPKEIIYRPD